MVIYLPILVSDHSPIILETVPKKEKRKRGIKLESCSVSIQGSPMFQCARKISPVRMEMFKWSRDYCHKHKLIWEDLVEDMTKVQLQLQDSEQAKQKDLTMKVEKMDEARVKLEFWKQRYKGKWLTHGDSGTKFLFRHVKSRQRRNEILMLQEELGNWHSSQDSIKVIFKNHFEIIYKADSNTSFPSWNQPHHLTSSLPILNDSNHAQLNVPITEEDVSKAVHQLGSLKAPGPDGVPALFYETAWATVQKDITKAILHFFEKDYLLKSWNATRIALILKVNRPETPPHFRLISLCNVVYKIISKILVNRLKPILPDLVSQNQNAFIASRIIGDNLLTS